MVKLPDESIEGAEHGAAFRRRKNQKGIGRFLRILGPGIVTGAADDDPSGIATYSQAGAQFGFSMPWTMLFTLPLMTAVQEACARVGAVTGKGLAAVVREHYPKKVLFSVVALVVAANTFNIGSDIGAMAASTQLLLPNIPFGLLAVGFAVLILTLEVFVAYKTYIRMLKWLAMALFAYLITAFIVNVPWVEVLKATLVPHVKWNKDFLFIIVGVIGIGLQSIPVLAGSSSYAVAETFNWREGLLRKLRKFLRATW